MPNTIILDAIGKVRERFAVIRKSLDEVDVVLRDAHDRVMAKIVEAELKAMTPEKQAQYRNVDGHPESVLS